MESSTSGGDVSASQRRRSSPSKTKPRSGGTSAAGAVPAATASSKMSDIHRSQSHEPRHTPPLFLIPSAATVRETTDPAATAGRPSSSSARLSDPGGKMADADDKEADDESRGRDTVVQLNYAGTTTDVLVDGGKSIGGKTSPVDVGAMSGGQGDDGDGGRCPRSPLDALAGCQAAWLGGIELAQTVVHGLLTTHRRAIQRAVVAAVLLCFAVYLVVAIWKSGLCTFAVIVFTLLAVLIQSLRLLKRLCGQRIDTYIIAPVRQVRHSKPWLYLTW